MSFFVYTATSYSSGSSPEWVRSLAMLLILLALLLSGLVAGLGREGTDFSPDNRYYRHYFELLGLRLGRWLPLPLVAGVTLKFYSTMGSSPTPGFTSWGVWDTSLVRYQKLVLLLSLQDSATGLVIGKFRTEELAKARQMAQEVAKRFGEVPVREYLVPQW